MIWLDSWMKDFRGCCSASVISFFAQGPPPTVVPQPAYVSVGTGSVTVEAEPASTTVLAEGSVAGRCASWRLKGWKRWGNVRKRRGGGDLHSPFILLLFFVLFCEFSTFNSVHKHCVHNGKANIIHEPDGKSKDANATEHGKSLCPSTREGSPDSVPHPYPKRCPHRRRMADAERHSNRTEKATIMISLRSEAQANQ